MPVLDARALTTDPKGVALLRDVLRRDQTAKDSNKDDRKAVSRFAKRRRAIPSGFPQTA